MKKSVLLVILSLFIVGSFLTIYNISTVGADSGFDSSYDSGGSDWGSDSSWDSGSGSGNSDPRILGLMTLSIVSVIIYYVLASKVFKFKNALKLPIWYKIVYKILVFAIIYLLFDYAILFEAIIFYIIIRIIMHSLGKDLKKNQQKPKQIIIENIDNDKLINDSFENYKDLQIAWMNFDYDKIKELVSDEMYNMYVNQLETLKVKNQQNIMDDIEFIEGYITDYKKVNNKEIIKVYLSVRCYDYIINTENKMTVRGNKNRKLILSYILTFERNIEVIKYCPRCGADVNNLTECSYCKSKIVNNTSKMKMTKKEIKSQR